jgi:hypothetical protein
VKEPSGWYVFHDFVAPRDGTATLTLTWANGAVDLDLSLTNAGCGYAYAKDCTLFVTTNNTTGTSEKVSREMRAGESYRIWVANFGTVDQPYRIDLSIP